MRRPEGDPNEGPGPSVHGTGSAPSTAIAAQLAKGSDLTDATIRARRFVADGLAHAHALGSGARMLGFANP
ncbi:MAG: hypothetical protein GY944_21765 [bacterium]|nr:hypothetical protein [bacterium]